jgi:hypothetical protein
MAPPRVIKGMPRHPIPPLLLARLAGHSSRQRKGIGAGLLLDALGRTLQVADVIGVRALLVHARMIARRLSIGISGSRPRRPISVTSS